MKKSAKSKKPAKAKKPSKAKKVAKAKKLPRKKRRTLLGAPHYAQSDRLAFRLITAADEDLYVGLFTDAETVKHFCPPLSPERAAQSFAKALAKSQQQPWTQRITAIVEVSSKKTVGIASIKMVDTDKLIAEVGILLKADSQSQRYATEASAALIDSAFRRHTIAGITASVAVGHKIGEQLVTTLGYERGGELPALGDCAARTSWNMSRETWAASAK
jgi:RimJ/RimL family protein N-acetyltransferase